MISSAEMAETSRVGGSDRTVDQDFEEPILDIAVCEYGSGISKITSS